MRGKGKRKWGKEIDELFGDFGKGRGKSEGRQVGSRAYARPDPPARPLARRSSKFEVLFYLLAIPTSPFLV